MNSAWSVKFVRVFMGLVCSDVKELLTGLSFVSTGAPLRRITLQKNNSTVRQNKVRIKKNVIN